MQIINRLIVDYRIKFDHAGLCKYLNMQCRALNAETLSQSKLPKNSKSEEEEVDFMMESLALYLLSNVSRADKSVSF